MRILWKHLAVVAIGLLIADAALAQRGGRSGGSQGGSRSVAPRSAGQPRNVSPRNVTPRSAGKPRSSNGPRSYSRMRTQQGSRNVGRPSARSAPPKSKSAGRPGSSSARRPAYRGTGRPGSAGKKYPGKPPVTKKPGGKPGYPGGKYPGKRPVVRKPGGVVRKPYRLGYGKRPYSPRRPGRPPVVKTPTRVKDGGYRGQHQVWHGRHDHKWNRCCWNSKYKCWTYGCGVGAAACTYYFCRPDNCYYPVDYQPYGTCEFEAPEPVCTYTGTCPIYQGEEQSCWTDTSWSEVHKCYLYLVGTGPTCIKYYWCPPDDCYYPVEYQPYGVCSFDEEGEEEETAG